MSTPILTTKLYIPPPQLNVVLRPRLIARLNERLHRKLTLISAPAGFGKTTLVSEWVAGCGRPTAWLSLDEGDSDPTRFLTYLVAAVQTIAPAVGQGVLSVLQALQARAQRCICPCVTSCRQARGRGEPTALRRTVAGHDGTLA